MTLSSLIVLRSIYETVEENILKTTRQPVSQTRTSITLVSIPTLRINPVNDIVSPSI